MSVHATAWVYSSAPEDLKPSEMLTLLVLADHANSETGTAYPSVKRLATHARLGESTVRAALIELCDRGIIEMTRESTPKTAAFYRFTQLRGAGSAGVQDLAPRGADISTGGVQDLAPRGAGSAPEPLGNHNGNRTTPLPPTGERKTGSIDSITQTSQIKNNPGTIPEGHEPRGGVSVPNQVKTWNELENPWWAEGTRQKKFEFFLENYPKKMSPVVEAKVEMRLALEDKIDDPDFMNRVWHGLQWWKRKWTLEETEERYIPNMGKWFARRQWEQANVNPGAMVNSGARAE